jgi:hypothetical protein
MKRTKASIDKMIATRKRNKAAERARDTAWINGHAHLRAHQHTQQQMAEAEGAALGALMMTTMMLLELIS